MCVCLCFCCLWSVYRFELSFDLCVVMWSMSLLFVEVWLCGFMFIDFVVCGFVCFYFLFWCLKYYIMNCLFEYGYCFVCVLNTVLFVYFLGWMFDVCDFPFLLIFVFIVVCWLVWILRSWFLWFSELGLFDVLLSFDFLIGIYMYQIARNRFVIWFWFCFLLGRLGVMFVCYLLLMFLWMLSVWLFVLRCFALILFVV